VRSIGLNTPDELIEESAEKVSIMCIDTANANNLEVLKKTEHVKNNFDIFLIVGNTANGIFCRIEQ